MNTVTLLHGSDHIIKKPDIQHGKEHNDYGRGFYCAREYNMAQEWACKQNTDGFVNQYEIDMTSLKILNLMDGKHNILNWMALLLKNREFSLSSEIAMDAREYLIANYLVDVSEYDIVVGYRADDSYFSYAVSFVQNGLSLRGLNQALRLGKLGEQTALVSEKAFAALQFIDAKPVDKTVYYPKFVTRDTKARETYRKDIKKRQSYREDIFILDILREEMKNDDPRIQRIVSE